MPSHTRLSFLPEVLHVYVAPTYNEQGHHRSGLIGDQENPNFHSLRSNKICNTKFSLNPLTESRQRHALSRKKSAQKFVPCG
jgi:hypothetical protein